MTHAIDFERIFQFLPGNYIILLPDAPRFTIVTFNKVRGEETFTKQEHIGKGIFEAFPDNPDDPQADGVARLTASLETVMREKKTHHMTVQKYDIPAADGSGFEERYWLPKNIPVHDESGNILYIIHHVQNLTEQIRAEQRETRTRQNFEDFFNEANTPFAVLTGRELRFNYVNTAYTMLIGNKAVEGKTVAEAIPELAAQPFVQQMQSVFESGITYHGVEVPVLIHDGQTEDAIIRFFNLSYSPFRDERGAINGVLAHAYDVTEQVAMFRGE